MTRYIVDILDLTYRKYYNLKTLIELYIERESKKEEMPNTPNTSAVKLSSNSVKTSEELDQYIQEEKSITVVQEGRGKEESTDLVETKYFQGSYVPNISRYLEDTDIVLTPEEERGVLLGIKKRTSGLLTAVPMICTGDRCAFKDNCPLYKINKAPVGSSCPIEGAVMDLYTKRYLDEYGVVADSFSETTVMTMLAATHVMEMRAWKVLGEEENNSGIISNVVGFNEDGDPIVQQQEHPAFSILERAWKWREKLLTSLVGTRREQYKREAALKQKSGDNSLSRRAAEMKAKIDSLTVTAGDRD